MRSLKLPVSRLWKEDGVATCISEHEFDEYLVDLKVASRSPVLLWFTTATVPIISIALRYLIGNLGVALLLYIW
jgi:hypothetical protein